jgi:hypothetical protein
VRVDYIHASWLSLIGGDKVMYTNARVITNDGTTMEIKSCLTQAVLDELERQILDEARRKFMTAAQESNLLPQVVEAPTYDTDVTF